MVGIDKGLFCFTGWLWLIKHLAQLMGEIYSEKWNEVLARCIIVNDI